jgi:kinesin family protein 3/17
LTRAEKELADRLAAEQKLKADLMAAEQNEAYMKQQYVSQEQELEIKTMKLKQLWAGYKSREQELAELQDEFAAEREELMDHLRQLTREIRLRDAMLESFMPLSALQVLLKAHLVLVSDLALKTNTFCVPAVN